MGEGEFSDVLRARSPRFMGSKREPSLGKFSPRPQGVTPKTAQTGVLKNLVVLVQFPDLAATHTRQEFEALFNTIGYNADKAQGSVKDYFREVSYNALTVDSVVTDWVTLDHGYAYYGTNDVNGDDLRPEEMVQEALAKLAATGFDFSTLDADNDGWVDSLTVIHAGGGAEFGGNNPNYIWSASGAMPSAVTYHGKKMQNYQTEAERRGWDSLPSSWGLTRIGVICHETGHLLGLPDLYDPAYASKGLGNFCLMAGGNWNGDAGTQPAHMSAWCKKTLGWITPTVAMSGGIFTVPRVEDNPTLYQLNGSFPSSQYFLIENRQGYGFDAGLPGSTRGLLIYHVDEDQPDNSDCTHDKVDLEEASGVQDLELNRNSGDDADYYRQGHNTSLTSNSTPNNLSYAGMPLGLEIVSVSASGPSMTFTIAALPAPSADLFLAISDVPGPHGMVELSFLTLLGRTYRLEFTDSLRPISWLPLTNSVAGTGASIQVRDPAVATRTTRFYRLVVE